MSLIMPYVFHAMTGTEIQVIQKHSHIFNIFCEQFNPSGIVSRNLLKKFIDDFDVDRDVKLRKELWNQEVYNLIPEFNDLTTDHIFYDIPREFREFVSWGQFMAPLPDPVILTTVKAVETFMFPTVSSKEPHSFLMKLRPRKKVC